MFNHPFTFKGEEYISFYRIGKECKNNFSYQCIILPEPTIEKDTFSFLIAPEFVEEGSSGAGIVMNGHEIRIIEYDGIEYHTILVAHVDVSTWVDLVLVYTNKKPLLYINGRLIAEGNPSPFQNVYPSGMIGGNEKGETFRGKVRSIKLWNEGLTHNQILHLEEDSQGYDGKVVWGKNFLNGGTYKKGNIFSPKVTIIMPTYNKYEEILLTLYSLESQTFHKNNFEVIICDDGSGDNTFNMVKEHPFSFSLTYIRSNVNIGRPNMRNLGLKVATGEVIIFLDAEILVKPDFIDHHYRAHLQNDRLVVSGSLVLHGVYTKFHPGFNQVQMKLLVQILRNNQHNRYNLQEIIKGNKTFTFLTKENVLDQSYTHYSFEKPFVQIYRDNLFKYYGNDLKGFHFPWILFCTGNVSVRATGFQEVGLFEEFPGYGWDDNEMGYRFYKKGYSFLNHKDLISFHQEHPVATSNSIDAVRNFVRMFNKYQEIEMRIFALNFVGIELYPLNNLLNSFLTLEEKYPSKFQNFKELYSYMQESIAKKLWTGEEKKNLAEGSPINLALAEKESETLLQIEEFRALAENFKYLIGL
ncbi:glycosyltransferase [Paucisalibacillus sp. EB02]|uniref:glycosyltransferase n=1 Tax=Paucisalibacillus sp. EB02 TaxID=1347087 RepID=UPI0004B980EB|nr:glycosyltransferase [Paucisalibacillus sp. EB02]